MRLMCKCIRGWTEDPNVEGSHNQVPVFCNDYCAELELRNRELENALEEIVRALTDSWLAKKLVALLLRIARQRRAPYGGEVPPAPSTDNVPIWLEKEK